MSLRFSLTSAVAVALALASTNLSAQADTTRRTTTSQTRVRVTKESTGEVATRRDSAFIRDSVARADSLARMERMRQDSITRADSINRMEQMRRDSITRDSTARADSIARASAATTTTTTTTTSDTIRSPVNPTMSSESYGMRRGGFYMGLAGGAAVPTGTISDFYKTGWGAYVPLGWQPMNSPLGVRVDLGYARFSGRDPGSTGLSFKPDNPNIWSGTANLTLDIVRWGENRRGALYAIGGGGVYRFTNFFAGDRTNNEVQSAFEGSPTTKGGWTGGGGVAFPIGAASLFIESRYTSVSTTGEKTKWVPVVLGLKWR
jgi:hypothetical protein